MKTKSANPKYPAHELAIKLSRLRSLDLKRAPLQEVKNIVSRLFDGITCMTWAVKSYYGHRVRRNLGKNLFGNLDELWYPKSHLIKRYGRANDIGKSIFYCSNDEGTAIIEMRPNVGDRLTVLQFGLKNQDDLPNVLKCGVPNNMIPLPESGINQEIMKLRPVGHTISDRGNRVLHKFIDGVFREDIHEAEGFRYKLSVAIAELIMLSPEIDGILYRSVARQDPGENLALKAESADRLFKPLKVWVVDVEQKVAPDKYLVRCYCTSTELRETGEIIWNLD